VFNSSFLKRYDIPEDRVAEIREDDIKLLQFGFEWLKATLFYSGQEKFQARKS
jgi:hypothetical protein